MLLSLSIEGGVFLVHDTSFQAAISALEVLSVTSLRVKKQICSTTRLSRDLLTIPQFHSNFQKHSHTSEALRWDYQREKKFLSMIQSVNNFCSSKGPSWSMDSHLSREVHHPELLLERTSISVQYLCDRASSRFTMTKVTQCHLCPCIFVVVMFPPDLFLTNHFSHYVFWRLHSPLYPATSRAISMHKSLCLGAFVFLVHVILVIRNLSSSHNWSVSNVEKEQEIVCYPDLTTIILNQSHMQIEQVVFSATERRTCTHWTTTENVQSDFLPPPTAPIPHYWITVLQLLQQSDSSFSWYAKQMFCYYTYSTCCSVWKFPSSVIETADSRDSKNRNIRSSVLSSVIFGHFQSLCSIHITCSCFSCLS